MRKYEWTRSGMAHNDNEGSYFHEADALEQIKELMTACNEAIVCIALADIAIRLANRLTFPVRTRPEMQVTINKLADVVARAERTIK